jgi:4-hydroxy-3-methylbut-2-enyl diphosphate reductase IspH
MKTYQECCDEVGYNKDAPYPVREYIFYAYENGQVIICNNEAEMKAYKNHEKVVTEVSNRLFNLFIDNQTSLTQKAYEVWLNALRTEYQNLSDAIFNICYSEAYERSHSAGYNEVSNCMSSVVYFANRVLATK